MIVNSNSNYITDYFDKVLSGKGGMVKAKDETKERVPVHAINLPKQLFMKDNNSNNITIYNYKKATQEQIGRNAQSPHAVGKKIGNDGKRTSIMNPSVDFCELLKKFLALHDSPDNYYHHHKVVIEKFLETCITSEVPEWLVEPFLVNI